MDKSLNNQIPDSSVLICSVCGFQVDHNLSRCPHCGAQLSRTDVNEKHDIPSDKDSQDFQELMSNPDTTEDYLLLRGFIELVQTTQGAHNLKEFFHSIVDSIVECMGFYTASVFIVNPEEEIAVLSEFKSSTPNFQITIGIQIKASSRSLIGMMLNNPRIYIRNKDDESTLFLNQNIQGQVSAEICLPIMKGDHLYAIIDMQHTSRGIFDGENGFLLQSLVEYIETSLVRYTESDKYQETVNHLSSLFNASHQLAQAREADDIWKTLYGVLLASPLQIALFSVDRNGLLVYSEQMEDQSIWQDLPKTLPYQRKIIVPIGVLEKEFNSEQGWMVVSIEEALSSKEGLPKSLFSIAEQNSCTEIAFIPGWNNGKLEFLLVFASQIKGRLTVELLTLYRQLADIAGLMLGRVSTSQSLEKQLAALQILNTISQAVSVETDLGVFYEVIHREVTSIMGKVNFAIATYDEQHDHIAIPYMYDGQTTRSVEAFPMGEGLTSILIRTKKSLMVVEDTERKTRELGAKLVGKPAKSWLGVPLLVGGEVIGAILLQDLENEGRFDEDDQRLLETLAAQVAVTIRNARLLEATYHQAERQQKLYEITSKIRSSSSISEILEITASELSQVLGAKRARVEIRDTIDVHQLPDSSDINGV